MSHTHESAAGFDCRDAFVATLEELAAADERIMVLVNDSISSSKTARFAQLYPRRLLNIGIAEQDMVGIAAGLSNGGLIPFVCSAACFLTARALEQIKVDVAYGEANVKLCGMSPGVAYGELGPTHHAIEDLAWLRAIANLTIIVPADPLETAQAVRAAADMVGPVYLRIARMAVPAVHSPDYRFALGRAARLREGSDVTLIANGIMVTRALAAAEELAAQGIGARVLNMATLSPLDEGAIVAAARETEAIVTIEEHSVRGGLGGAVAEVVVSHCPVPMRLLGLPPAFCPTGSAAWLLERFGLSPQGIAGAAVALLHGDKEAR
jgi:transketolase